MEELAIGGRMIGPAHPPYVIAEIGANHNGDMTLCRELIDLARQSGADAVKFQSWSSKSLISKGEYDRNTRYVDNEVQTLEEEIKKYQLTPEQQVEIAAYCRVVDIACFASCFSTAEADLWDRLDAPAFKVASMDVTHGPLLEYIASKGRPVILSTGLASLGEIENAVAILRRHATPFALLHCISVYPCPPAIVNLRNMATLQDAFSAPVGYSDHTLGLAVSLAACALGASIIEKHFTKDRRLPGWDHAVSAEPQELQNLVQQSRDVHAALGSRMRTLSCEELAKRKVMRRSLVAARPLKRGEKFTTEHAEFKRPGGGVGPGELSYVLGRPVTRDVAVDDELSWSDFA
jgi:N,N'-diacetyllegionaminate synthase